jgi:hypothetical protein
VRDGINLARRQIPAIALVTSDFRKQGNFVAKASGMPDIPRVELPHPVAGSGAENMQRVADGIVQQIADVLGGKSKGEVPWQCELSESEDVK